MKARRVLVDHAMLGVYVPGTTLVHRARPGVKMTVLVVFIVAVTLLAKTPAVALGCLAVPVAGYVLARIPVRIAVDQLLPPLPVLVLLGAVTAVMDSFSAAVVMTSTVFAAIMAATLVTLTTPVARMLDALESALSPLQRVGVPASTLSLVLVLTIRMIPVQLRALMQSIEAARARGARLSLVAVLVPLVVRSVRTSEQLGDALAARGVGDEDSEQP